MQLTKHQGEIASSRAEVAGVWFNQHSSKLTIEIDEHGMISGTFETGAEIEGTTTRVYPVTGFAVADAVAFCVSFDYHDCVTAWSGSVYAEGDEYNLSTLWQMTASAHQNEAKRWKATWAGADVFRRKEHENERIEKSAAPSYPFWRSHGKSR
jgi:hypothetical protein